ncbi:MAG: hypothetical protein OXB84_07215 [Halobacteriovoraceae bacterium]|nr:hypothetical protein [Halobacteriovoraceae bacterium]
MEKHVHWGQRFKQIFRVCQNEIKRTAQIGKKMFYATRTNSELHDAYEQLGLLAAREMKDGKLKWNNPRVGKLIDVIKSFEENLANIEDEVGQIKSIPSSEKELPLVSKIRGKEYPTKDN